MPCWIIGCPCPVEAQYSIVNCHMQVLCLPLAPPPILKNGHRRFGQACKKGLHRCHLCRDSSIHSFMHGFARKKHRTAGASTSFMFFETDKQSVYIQTGGSLMLEDDFQTQFDQQKACKKPAHKIKRHSMFIGCIFWLLTYASECLPRVGVTWQQWQGWLACATSAASQ